EWQVPPAAKLGVYEVTLEGKGDDNSFGSGSFRVEEFRLPVFEGRLNANDKKPLIAATAVPVDLQVSYLAGGPAARLPTQVSALLRPQYLSFDGHDGFRFDAPRVAERASYDDGDGEDQSESSG